MRAKRGRAKDARKPDPARELLDRVRAMKSRRRLTVDQLADRDAENLGQRRKTAEVRTSDAVFPVRDRGLVDAEFRGEILLAQLASLAKLRDATVDGAGQLFSLGGASTRHVAKLERCSGLVNSEQNTVLPSVLQPSEPMGIAAHKKSPPNEPKEIVTPGFRKLVREILKANAAHNEFHELERDHVDYRISSHAELAEAIKGDKPLADQQQLSGVIGPAKVELEDVDPATLVDRSYLVGRIRRALDIKAPTTDSIDVPRDRVEAVRQLLELKASDFKAIADMIKKRSV